MNPKPMVLVSIVLALLTEVAREMPAARQNIVTRNRPPRNRRRWCVTSTRVT